jgi:hypothetical protein
MNRRAFLSQTAKSTALISATALSASKVLGANDRVRIALIGCGGRGTHVAKLMAQVPGAEFVGACDVYDDNTKKALEWMGTGAQAHKDFRKVLERKDVDAVLVGAPDHWHAIPTVLACEAGKDVYVEKPLAHDIKEGRAMVTAARRYNRVVQTGTQHRSAPHYQEVQRIIQSGELGEVRYVYYGILVALAAFGLVILVKFPAVQTATISAVLQNIALRTTALMSLYVNRKLLPRELQQVAVRER